MKSVMKLAIVASLLGAVLFASPVAAAQGKVGIVDIELVISESRAGRQANAALASLVTARQGLLDQLVAEINTLATEIGALADEATEESRAKQVQFDQLVGRLQQQAELIQAEIEQERLRLRNLILVEIGEVLQRLGDQDDYLMILDVSVAFYYKRVADLTWEVVRRYDDLHAARTQGATPAATPATQGGNQ